MCKKKYPSHAYVMFCRTPVSILKSTSQIQGREKSPSRVKFDIPGVADPEDAVAGAHVPQVEEIVFEDNHKPEPLTNGEFKQLQQVYKIYFVRYCTPFYSFFTFYISL